MAADAIEVWACNEAGEQQGQEPLDVFNAPKPGSEVLSILAQHYAGRLKFGNRTMTESDSLTAGKYKYIRSQAAAAATGAAQGVARGLGGPAGGAAAAAGSSSVVQAGGLGPVIRHLNELVLETRGTNALLRASTHLLRQQFAQQFKYTSSQATKYRNPEFKAEVIKRYGSASADHPGKIWCNALGQWVHQDLVVAAHIFKYAWRATVGEMLGFPNINDPANALMLLKPVEEAFDVGYMCFIWEGTPGRERGDGVYRMRWLGGPKVPIAGAYPWHNPSNEKLSPANKEHQLEINNAAGDRLMFSDLDGKTLEFRTTARPYRRSIVFQARFALKQALSEGRMTMEQVAEIAPKLVAASPRSANLQMYWQRFAFEDPENPPEPVDTHDPFHDIEPDSASDEEEGCDEGHDGDPVPVEGCP